MARRHEGADWHAACRARSHDEFRAKLGTVLEEIDEAEECFDLLYDTNICRTDECQRLRRESKELRAIFAKATRTANQNAERRRRDQRSRTR